MWPERTGRFLLSVLALTAATLLVAELVARLPSLWGGAWPPSRYRALRGHRLAIAMLLINTIALVGLTEELSVRGFLMSRVALGLGGSQAAWYAAVGATALLFGLLHFQHGPGTVITGILVGLIYGVTYVVGGRNLWRLVIAHSLHDTIRLGWLLSLEGEAPGPPSG